MEAAVHPATLSIRDIAAARSVLLLCALLLPACASARGSVPEPATASVAEVDSTRVYDIKDVTVNPRLLNSPAVMRALEQNYRRVPRGAEGVVQLRLIVERNGHPSTVVVVHSSDARFDAPAIDVVRAMRFNPAEVNGVPVRVRIDLPVRLGPQS